MEPTACDVKSSQKCEWLSNEDKVFYCLIIREWTLIDAYTGLPATLIKFLMTISVVSPLSASGNTMGYQFGWDLISEIRVYPSAGLELDFKAGYDLKKTCGNLCSASLQTLANRNSNSASFYPLDSKYRISAGTKIHSNPLPSNIHAAMHKLQESASTLRKFIPREIFCAWFESLQNITKRSLYPQPGNTPKAMTENLDSSPVVLPGG